MTGRIFIFAVAAAAALAGAGCRSSSMFDERCRERLERLDATIADKERYEQRKRARIDSIEMRVPTAADSTELYALYGTLLDEYGKYDVDAALSYAHRKLDLVSSLGEVALMRRSKIDLATLYAQCGNYVEALDMIAEVDTASMSTADRYAWHNARYVIYEGMSLVSVDADCRKAYVELLDAERHALVGLDLPMTFVQAEIMRSRGDDDGALELLSQMSDEEIGSIHGRAVWAYSVAQSYINKGESNDAIYYLAESALCDLQTPVHEYRSLYELSALLYDRGDIERAYEYINRSLKDARQANARINIHSIERLLPIITRSYDTLMSRKQHRLNMLLAGVTLLTLLLAVAMILVRRDSRRAARAERRQAAANEELKTANAELLRINALLHDANNLKESYLCTYIDLCSDYIGRIDEYRRELNGVARSGGAAQLLETLKSNALIDRELKSFYERFDRSFLDLFPDFIDQFNALLREEERVSLAGGELLSTELRIFALIRLGVTDSVKIAAFLRRSVSTVYNYRVKMRNAALGDREGFERRVMSIARLD